VEKKKARRIIRRAIQRLTPLERRQKSLAIRARLLALPELKTSEYIMAYLPMNDEWDTRPLLADLIAAGKRVYTPRTALETRRMTPIRLTSLRNVRPGAYGILEPDSEESCPPSRLDFLLVPGRAFDRQGNRLGRGAGFYDRFMGADDFRAVTCAGAFACQILDDVPHDAHDLPVQIIVTENETLRTGA